MSGDEHARAVLLQEQMRRALNRINASTSVARVRADEVERATRHGAPAARMVRLEHMVERLQQIAGALEAELGINLPEEASPD